MRNLEFKYFLTYAYLYMYKFMYIVKLMAISEVQNLTFEIELPCVFLPFSLSWLAYI